MRLFLDNKEITLEELKHRLNNCYVSDSGYEIVELVDIVGNNLYFEIWNLSIRRVYNYEIQSKIQR